MERRKPLQSRSAPKRKRSTPSKTRGADTKVRKSAHGKPCMVRIPGVCTDDRETTVAAHIRIAGAAGVGQKPTDLLTARACEACHAVIDGHRPPPQPMSRQQIQLYALEGMARTQVEYEREGLVKHQ